MAAKADVMVIFGITGDLAKKMTFRALYRLEARGRLDTRIIGVARNDWEDSNLVEHCRSALKATRVDIDEKVFKRLAKRLDYVQGVYDDPGTYARVAEAIKGHRRPVFYLEIPPSLFSMVVHGLGTAGLTKNARVVIEKPFGHDLKSARALNESLHQVLREDQMFRIDHFLGKEPVMDLTYLRFANSMLEPVWNRQYVSHVVMTMAEDFGVEDRGRFYDPVGTLRDVVQNHLMQVLALTAMEPPAGDYPDAIRDKKLELFKSIPAADPKRYVRGQYRGYKSVDGVATGSTTETYLAVELGIDSWRWSGVPFFIRAGKAMKTTVTQVEVVFKQPPPMHVGPAKLADPNTMVIRISPTPGARLRFWGKKAGEDAYDPEDLEVLFEKHAGEDPEPYERLLDDAIHGRAQLFTREDELEETWRIVQPLLDKPGKVYPYAKGSWGPKEADKLVRGVCEWDEPWMPPEGGYSPPPGGGCRPGWEC